VDCGPVDCGAIDDRARAAEGLLARCRAAVARGGRAGDLGAHVPPAEIAPVRILHTWLASHPDTPRVWLDPMPGAGELGRLLEQAQPAG